MDVNSLSASKLAFRATFTGRAWNCRGAGLSAVDDTAAGAPEFSKEKQT